MPSFSQETYEKEWAAIDSLEREGLWRSALEQVNDLHERAVAENNPAQVVKTIIYRSKFEMQLSEDGLALIIRQLEEEAEQAAFPIRSVYQSMVGELYQQYIDRNMWRLSDRTQVAEDTSGDLATWSLERLNRRVLELFAASVSNSRLREVPVQNFDAITTEPQLVEGLRPTLYDFLIHRAIDQFSNDRNYLTRPAFAFHIDDPAAFAPVERFTNYRFDTRDSLSYQYQALQLFQELLAFHAGDEDPAALVDADLKRLNYVYEKAVMAGKDSLYRDALTALQTLYEGEPVSAEVDYYLAQWHYQRGLRYDSRQNPELQWELKAAKAICDRVIATFPEAYGAGLCRSLRNSIDRSSLNVQTEEVNLPDQYILARVAYRNLDKAFFKVVPVEESDRDSLEQMNLNDQLDYLSQKEPAKQWSEDLPEVGDFQEHSVEVGIEPLPYGVYALVLGSDAGFSGETPGGVLFFHVSRLAVLERNAWQAGNEFMVVNRQTGEPLQGVKAEFYTRQYNRTTRRQEFQEMGSVESNAEGFIIPKLDGNNYYLIKYILGRDTLFLRDGFSNYSRFNRGKGIQESTFFFMDRAIYRPGQTVHFKGLAVSRNGEGTPRIIAGRSVKITLYDVNRQPVEVLDLETNEYGTFHGTFRAPQGGLRGQMTLESSIGPSSIAFRVEEYKRPRFEVTFEPLQEDFDLGDEVAVSGTVKAFAGNTVDGALVKYRVVRQVRFPWWPVWRGSSFYPPPQSEEMEIANGVATTDENGVFRFSFEAIPDPSVPRDQDPAFRYTVYADVTDITGETQSGEKTVILAYKGLQATLRMPDQIDRNEPPTIAVITSNLDGQPVPADGTITIHRLEAPETVFIDRYWDQPDQSIMEENTFKQRFPHYAFRGENEPENWPVSREVYSATFETPDRDSLQPEVADWPVGQYQLHLTTQDSEGNPVEVKRFFTVYDSQTGEIPANILGWKELPQTQAKPGEEVLLRLATATRGLFMRYDVEGQQGNLEEGAWLNVREWTELPYEIQEADRGNIHFHVAYVKNNRAYTWTKTLKVPWSNKKLNMTYGTFRDKLRPGAEEEWRLTIKGPAGERVAAEMVATMYDASLDQFVPHSWSFNPFQLSNYALRRWSGLHFRPTAASLRYLGRREETPDSMRQYRHLNWFNLFRYGGYGQAAGIQYRAMEEMEMAAAPMADTALQGKAEGIAVEEEPPAPPPPAQEPPAGEPAPAPVQVRTNLDETVFFMPELRTDEEGNIIISFTMNEALTRWKFLGMAHTKDMEYALTEREVVTQKELMVTPNVPRFVREGDEIEFVAKVSNLTENALAGTATLQLFDGLTMEPIDARLGNEQVQVPFEAAAGQSARVAWKLKVPKDAAEIIVHRIIAQSGPYSDGEESALPVLTNRMLVTESMPVTVRGKEKNTFSFERMEKAAASPTLQQHTLTLEFTSNPAWFAIKALPYLMEYPHECAEQVFNRLYANSLAGAVVNAHPRIKAIFEKWRAQGGLESELMRNQELKAVLLEETPWVLEAQSEEQQRKNIALLFDLDRMQRERESTLRKLADMQASSGGFPWFPGGREDWFITQYIVEGLGRLQRMEVLPMADVQTTQLIREAVAFIDRRLTKHYQDLQYSAKEGRIKLSDDHLSAIAIHYLYARSFFPDVAKEAPTEEAFLYFLDQAETYWLDKGIYEQGLITMAMHRHDRQAVADRIVKSLRERALRNEELGMYWKYPSGWRWHQLPIETHALMIEVFSEAAADPETVEELQIWLLKNKQVNHWATTKATAAAVYALFNQGGAIAGDLLTEGELVQVNFSGVKKKYYDKQLEAAMAGPEAGTGYIKATWKGEEILPEMNTLRIKNPNRTIAWGSLHWQYFEDLDNITSYEDTPLELKKQLFRQVPSDTGPQLVEVSPGTRLTPGDLLTVRIELRVDRDMEYLHMKDLRASGLEPVNVLSSYQWQGGLGYYQSTGDAATHFFFDRLPRGTYVFEYPLRVNHQGEFSNGITSIQSMYAPEFNSHSEGVRIRVAEEEN